MRSWVSHFSLFVTLLIMPSYAYCASADTTFEAVAIKLSPNNGEGPSLKGSATQFVFRQYTLRRLLLLAYNIKSDTLVKTSDKWMERTRYDIIAKLTEAESRRLMGLSGDQKRKAFSQLFQNLLIEEFGLRVSWTERESGILALVVTDTARISTKRTSDLSSSDQSSITVEDGHLKATNISMNTLADELSAFPEMGERNVVNETKLIGGYTFDLSWTPDYGKGIPLDAAQPGILSVLQHDLGLSLHRAKGEVRMLVVDSAVKPVLQ